MADKKLTIKNASDKDLNELLIRLRKERELLDLVTSIRRTTNPIENEYDYRKPVSTEEPIESLYHFGIKGMKWGQRRSSSSDSSPGSSDHIRKKNLKAKKLKDMSNDELKELTARLQLEKQYKDLTKTDTSPGKKFVSDVLTNAAKQTATTYASRYMTKGLDAVLGGKK